MGSFRARLLVVMTLLLGACAGFIQLYFPAHFHTVAEDGLARQTHHLSVLTASAIGPSLDFDDKAAAVRRLTELSAVEAADAAIVYDTWGTEFAGWSRNADAARIARALPPAGYTSQRDRYLERTPVHGRAASGELVLLMSARELERDRDESARVVSFAALGMLGAGLIAALVLGTWLLRPVSRVTQVARRISAGDDGARDDLDIGRADEIGVMARTLRDMLTRLFEQHALLESQSECSSEGILVAKRDGSLVAHNRRFRELWNISPEALQTLKLPEVLLSLRNAIADDVPLLQRADDFTTATLEPFKLRDGRTLTAYRAPIAGSDGQPFALAYYFRDVSELRAAQDQLVLADRRSSVGRLAAGVAHEVNNPLTFIISNVSYCVDELRLLPLPKENVELLVGALDDIKVGAERVAYIVRSLTALSRGDEGEREPLDVVECLKKTLTIAAPELRHRAQVITHFELSEVVVDANSVRLGQVFLNLLINAAKACVEGKPNTIDVTVAPGPDKSVEVRIKDTGVGMSPEVLGKLFTPFFTTREIGKGTGLGLSISREIVQSYGGTIEVDSQQGEGSTFTVRLPQSADQPRDANEAKEETPLRALKLLVVDDEAQVARAVWRTLMGHHHVTVSQKPAEALEKVKAGERFDVVLTDLHMPEMTGAKLYEELVRADPSLAAHTLFMSGGAVTDEIRAFAASHEQMLFPKPIDPRRLRSVLARFTREGTLHA